MTAQIIPFPLHRAVAPDVLVTKTQLADRWQVSERWIELQQRDHGLPVQKDARSRLVRYSLRDVEAWRTQRRAS